MISAPLLLVISTEVSRANEMERSLPARLADAPAKRAGRQASAPFRERETGRDDVGGGVFLVVAHPDTMVRPRHGGAGRLTMT